MKMKSSLTNLKRIFSVLMAVLLLVSTIGIMSVSADSVATETPVPTKIIYGPDNFVGEAGTYVSHNTYVTQEDINAGRFNKNLVADFNISYSSFGLWSSTSLFLDSAGSNDKSGFNFMIYGPSGFASNAKDFIAEPNGVGIVLKRGTSNGNEIINAVELGVQLSDFVKTEYRIIIKRVVGDTETSVDFYMFDKKSAIPSEPMFSFSYTNEEYGSPAKSISFGSWELQELTVSDVKLYDYDADISALKVTETSTLSIENPSVVPTKFALEPVTCIGEAGKTVYHTPYVTKEDVSAGTYSKYLIADFDISFSTFGGWRSASLWLDSYDLNDWGGFCFVISGESTFKSNAAELIDNPSGVGVILKRSTKPGSEKLGACALGVSDKEFIGKEYRIIIKRVVGNTDTFVEFYMFEKTDKIPSEPMFSFSYTNEEYGPASTSIGFTTWEAQEFTTSNVKLYNYDLDIKTPSVEEPSIVPTKTAIDSITNVGEAGKTVYHTPYVTKEDVSAGTYSKYLVADFDISFSTFGGWRSASLWLDSYDLNDWGGFCFVISGESTFKSNAAELIDNPSGVGVILKRSTKPGSEKLGACALGVSDKEFIGKEYRIIIKRVVGDTDTFVEFYMFEKTDKIPSEPMFSFSYTNEEYGPASTSIGFTTWEAQEFTTSNVKLYNYDLDIRPYYPTIVNYNSSYNAEEEAAETTVIDRTSTSEEVWLDTKAPLDDYDYSIAVVGDTQYINRHYPEQFPAIYDWILDNADDKKMEFVVGLGDITDGDTASEWELAQTQINRLDGVLPYSIVRGNHDGKANYNTYFPYEKYADILGGSYDETMLNTWQELIVGETKYLILNLDYGPNDSIIAWANDVVASHPEHNIIITTHAYLNDDGMTLDVSDGKYAPTINGGYNDGNHLWDKLVKKHENIVLVLSGHISSEDIVVSKRVGENGNTVTQMLVDPQGMDVPGAQYAPTGMVCMLYFSNGGSKVQVEWYSTVKEQYFKEINQFTIDVDTINDAPEQPAGDFDGDGTVNGNDVVILRKKLIGIDVSDIGTVTDLTDDDIIDLRDLVRLKKIIAGIDA